MMEKIDFLGWPNSIRLSNGDAELIVITDVGPRIMRYGFVGGPNAFHIDPDTHGQTGGEEWVAYGGHRIWHSPEKKGRSDIPDNGPIEAAEMTPSGELCVANATEPETGIKKEMFIALAPSGSAVRVRHRLTNHGLFDVTIAPWALSIVANGGRVVLPQEDFVDHKDNVDPVRPLVLWKFTDMADPRWRWGTRYLSLRQLDEAKMAQKVGVYNSKGWGAHLTDEQAFIIHISIGEAGPEGQPDFGCNFETYTEGPFQELESLGPLATLKPGASAEHAETWYLAKSGPIPDNDNSLDARLLPLVAEARAATMDAFGK